jgi:hypothetical protein
VIIRKNAGKNHYYVDENGIRLPGVTTIIGKGTSKDSLITWAGNATAAFTLDNWDALAAMPPAARLKRMQGGRYEDSDKAKDQGTAVHKLAEHLVAEERVTVPDLLAGHVKSYVRFLDEFDVRAEHIEPVVGSYTHRYAGSLDLIARIMLPDIPEYDDVPRDSDGYVMSLLDIKTGRTGIYGDAAIQVAAYRFAEVLVTNGSPAEYEEIDMPPVDWCGAVWVTGDGYELRPLTSGREQFMMFRYITQVSHHTDEGRGLVGQAVIPPTTSAYRLVKAED